MRTEQIHADAPLAAETAPGLRRWRVDPTHTSIDYAVRHMFTSYRGVLQGAEGVVEWDPARPEAAVVDVRVDVRTLSTGLEARDAHLQGEDFFDAARHPYATLRGRGLEPTDVPDRYRLVADLTLRGVTREVVFDVAFEGEGDDPWGSHRAGATARGSIRRKDFGMVWNAALDRGGVVLGDAVDLTLHVEAIRET